MNADLHMSDELKNTGISANRTSPSLMQARRVSLARSA
jgi:hypothetical protein